MVAAEEKGVCIPSAAINRKRHIVPGQVIEMSGRTFHSSGLGDIPWGKHYTPFSVNMPHRRGGTRRRMHGIQRKNDNNEHRWWCRW